MQIVITKTYHLDNKAKYSKNYCEKSVRVSAESHGLLSGYIDKNPVFKLNRIADIAINHFMNLPARKMQAFIMQYQLGENE